LQQPDYKYLPIFVPETALVGLDLQKNPNRFKGKVPVPKSLPVAAWINKPATDELESNLITSVSHFH